MVLLNVSFAYKYKQKYIDNTYSKIIKLKELAGQKNPNLFIEIDGGVGIQNAQKLIEAGANVLVAGNAVFAHENPEEMISNLKNIQADTLKV